MSNIIDYYKSIRFSLSYSFRFVPTDTVIIGLLYMFSAFIPYATAFLLGELVNSIITASGTSSFGNIWSVLILYSIVHGIPGIIGNLQMYVNRRRMIKMQLETEIDILRMRERIDIAKYEDPKFLDLIQRAFRNGPNPIYQLSNTQFDVLKSLTGLVVGTVLAVHFDVWVYLIVVVTAIPAFIMDIKFAGQSWSIWAKDSLEQRRFADLRQHLNYRTLLIEVKLFQASSRLLNWIREILTNFGKKQLGLEKRRVWLTSSADVLALLGFAGALFLIVRGVVSGGTELGTLVYIMGTLSSVRSSIARLLEDISGQYENHLMVKDMIEFMNTKPVIIEAKDPVKLSLKSAPEIVFEDVGFKYQGSDMWSLRNINLTFNAGYNIGLVGNNGAGKTTMVKLLCRIYDPSEGRILVNGVDLKEISTTEWWSYMAVMFQDYASYDFVVKDAIAISRPDKPANLTKVVEAAKVSQSHEFIVEWENKYDEQIGLDFKGKEPSKGQRQKLSIAKILYRDGFVMILDEPTASVDAESEAKIFDSIENIPKDRTAILISHDFSTISQCDKIFVLDKGMLTEEGNHKTLVKEKGMYAELYQLQAKRFKK